METHDTDDSDSGEVRVDTVREDPLYKGLDNLMKLIERRLEIGDSWRAGFNIEKIAAELRENPAPAIALRLATAQTNFDALIEHERMHGRFSKLDRDAPEILYYEAQVRRRKQVSYYGSGSGVDG